MKLSCSGQGLRFDSRRTTVKPSSLPSPSLLKIIPHLSLSLYLQIFKTCSSFKALKVIHGGCKLKGIQRSFVLVLFIIFLTIIFTRISTLALSCCLGCS
uniref:Uncharacterized protein n=1 Tax=Helianthus annuus TaxID=4232 RepID=A0A251RZ49_HELAN